MSKSDYRKLFESADIDLPLDDDLNKLALIMSGKIRFPDSNFLRQLKRAFSEFIESFRTEPSRIPSGYTYLGQFIIHDISYDSKSDRHNVNNRPFNFFRDPSEIVNLRNPTFDLENIYGYGSPTTVKPLRNELLVENSRLPLLKLDRTLGVSEAKKSFPNDLLRKKDSNKADIIDPRNDENLILAQTQVAFTKFHNALVVRLNEEGTYTYSQLFEQARKLAIRYYQTIILTDFLPRVVKEDTLEFVRKRINTEELFFQPKPDDLFLPLEFTVAAFRFGHSMIRETYNFNRIQTIVGLTKLLMFTGFGNMNENSARTKLISSWIINWNLFYEFNGVTVNYAEEINTELPSVLLKLKPTEIFGNEDGRASSLAALDLFRARSFKLLTGQQISQQLFNTISLDPNEIENLIDQKKYSDPNVVPEEEKSIKTRLKKVFREKTPLWFYILAEAEIQMEKEKNNRNSFINAGKLGDVGSRIVAETVLQLLYLSEYSIINPDFPWEDGEDILQSNGKFGMTDMLNFIKQMEVDHHAELYPDVNFAFDEINPLG